MASIKILLHLEKEESMLREKFECKIEEVRLTRSVAYKGKEPLFTLKMTTNGWQWTGGPDFTKDELIEIGKLITKWERECQPH